MGCCFSSPCSNSSKQLQASSSGRKPRRWRRRRSVPNGTTTGNAHVVLSMDRRASAEHVTSISGCPSLLSDGEDYHSCRDDFSVTDGVQLPPLDSPPGTPCQSMVPLGTVAMHGSKASHQHGPQPASSPVAADAAAAQPANGDIEGASDSASYVDSLNSEALQPNGEGHLGKRGRPGCLSLIEALSSRVLTPHPADGEVDDPLRHGPGTQRRRLGVRPSTAGRLSAGFSLNHRDMSKPWTDIVLGYEDGDGQHYNIRGMDYMKSKLKVKSAASIYKLAAADMVTFDRKQNHIAKLINLPHAPPAIHKMSPSSDACFPPMLVINLQLPSYSPSIFGGSTDGLGWSVVLYFTLPEDFNPATFPNQKALGLFRRFVQNEKEADGTPTRDRFKVIPRVVNVDEWAQKGPLSTAEFKLMTTYNEKPVLSRPQHLYFHGPNYLEVDLDIHTYAYLARTALVSFMSRLSSVVWEVAFVIQGNSSDELPEQVLACARIYRTDFAHPRPFTSFLPRGSHNGEEEDTLETERKSRPA